MQESVKQDRDKYIGGSDIPVIMNLSTFKTRYHLLLEKAGLREDEFKGNQYTEYGNIMESKIREYINRSFPKATRFEEGKHTIENAPEEVAPLSVRIHTDGENAYSILEIKTTSTIYEDVNEYKTYLVQLLFYMVIADKESGLLAVYERPEDLSAEDIYNNPEKLVEEFDPERLHRYTIERSNYEDLIAEILKAVDAFEADLLKIREDPFISEEDLLPVEIADIASRVLAFEYQLSQMKETEKKLKADKARLFDVMNKTGVKSWKTPNGYTITRVDGSEDKFVKVKYLDEAVAERKERETKADEVIKNLLEVDHERDKREEL